MVPPPRRCSSRGLSVASWAPHWCPLARRESLARALFEALSQVIETNLSALPVSRSYTLRMGWRGVVLLLLVLVSAVACSNDLVMPDLEGMRNHESEEAMDEAGISDYTIEWREGSDPLVVIDQTPGAGEPVMSETEVSVTLSGR